MLVENFTCGILISLLSLKSTFGGILISRIYDLNTETRKLSCCKNVLPWSRFVLHEHVLHKYSSILHALLHSQSQVLGFQINHLHKNSNHLHLYTHTNIHHDSIFLFNFKHFHSVHIYIHTLTWFCLTRNLVSFTPDINLKCIYNHNPFHFIWNTYLRYTF